MWKSFENHGLQTSKKVSWEKKETCAKHKIDRSQNGRSKNQSKNRVAQKKRSKSVEAVREEEMKLRGEGRICERGRF